MIAVVGEALIDLGPDRDTGAGLPTFVARPGGSPMNVAVGLARLAVPVTFLGRLSTDRFGRHLTEHLQAEGVAVGDAPRGPEPTAVAMVTLADDGHPTYRFLWDGTADRVLVLEDLPRDLGAADVLHVGSVSTVLTPGAAAVDALVDRERPRLAISFDPNVRPDVLGDRHAYRERVDGLVPRADIVKVSREDLSWLVPDEDPEVVAARWASHGPAMVVVTLGADGALGIVGDDVVRVGGREVESVDAVGAGDAFTAGLLAWLHNHDLIADGTILVPDRAGLRSAIDFAVTVATATVGRPGADPPRRHEL